jgi:hypothetical protein
VNIHIIRIHFGALLVAHSKHHEKVQILSFNRVDYCTVPSVIVRINFQRHNHASRLWRRYLWYGGTLTLRMECDARNTGVAIHRNWEAQSAKRGRRSEKVFENPGRRPQKTVVSSVAVRVREVSHRFSLVYLRQHKRILGLAFTGRHSSSNSNLRKERQWSTGCLCLHAKARVFRDSLGGFCDCSFSRHVARNTAAHAIEGDVCWAKSTLLAFDQWLPNWFLRRLSRCNHKSGLDQITIEWTPCGENEFLTSTSLQKWTDICSPELTLLPHHITLLARLLQTQLSTVVIDHGPCHPLIIEPINSYLSIKSYGVYPTRRNQNHALIMVLNAFLVSVHHRSLSHSNRIAVPSREKC